MAKDSLSTWIDHPHSSPCNWTGVTCNPAGSGRVVELDLSSMDLRGPISPHIGNLSFLTSLQLQTNQFYGPIPDQLGKLLHLKTINISFNSINGEIPANLSRCSELIHLDLMRNQISGEVPSEFGLLSKLRVMNLARNVLSGTIPPAITNLTALTDLNLGTNNFGGRIPADLAKLRNLRSLDLTINNLMGTVPPPIYNMSSIVFLALASNQLWGEIPIDIGFTLPNLLGLNLCVNHFTGTIPISIHNLTKIRSIRMRSMLLHGSVPPGLENLKDLEMYNIAFNNIASYGDDGLSILTSLTNSTRLEFLSLEGNLFEGRIPESIGNLSKVSLLFLGENRIYGRLPESIGSLNRLSTLNVSYNSISGEIPSEIGRLWNLHRLDLSGNTFSGEIPASFGKLENLNEVHMSGNKLVGNIPVEFRGFKRLNSLDLSRNMLNGTITKEILRLSLGTLLNLSKNSFSGSLSEDVGLLDSVAAIDFSDNMLSGTIPYSISGCKSLEKLLLANNKFTGSIPKSLGNLVGLVILDISSNQLSGSIPSELEKLRALKMMNLSFNNLEGRIPDGTLFTNASIIDLQGNPKLCSSSSCGRIRNNGGKDGARLIIVSTIIGVTIALALCFLVVWMVYTRKFRVQDLLVLSKSFKVQRLSYNDIRKGTENFEDKNLIGRGSFGSVYKGRIGELGPWVAIKVFDLNRAGAIKSFKAECATMKKVRHRNLVKLITTCSSTDFKNNEFLALVYELMSNGSLSDWITGARTHTDGGTFNVVERLNVAIDVAIAINYLHNECEGQVVHCDLKPNNILLDEHMTAKVGDFGLAKLFDWDDDQHSIGFSNTLNIRGSIGYIPPEYGMGQKPRAEGDVYSYGITLLELFTGRGPTSDSLNEGWSLKKWVENALISDEVEKVLDPILLTNIGKLCNKNGISISVEGERLCLAEVLRIGIGCTLDSFDARFTIDEVLSKLKNVKQTMFTA